MKKILKLWMAGIMMMTLMTICPSVHAEEKDDIEKGTGFDDIEEGYSRELYSSLYRNATYRVMNEQGGVYTATARQGYNFYINGKWENCSNCTIRELVDTKGQRLRINKASPLYQEPFAKPYFHIGTLPAGTYQIEAQSLDLYKVSDGNFHGWVQAELGVPSIVGTAATLGVSAINGIPVHEMLAPIGESIRAGIGMKPKYITIHNTANTGVGATARNHAQYLYNGESRKDFTSWHFTVDNYEIWQSLPMNEVGYHAGDGYGMGNNSTIALEICENADGNYRQAEENAAVLTAYLLSINDLPADAIRMHQDWSGKHCPHNMLDATKNSMGWSAFKKRVKEIYDSIHYAKKLSFEGTFQTVRMDETIQTKVAGTPSSAKLGTLSYRTGNEKIAVVDDQGKVTGKALGNTYLYVTNDQDITARIAIKVIPAKIEKMYFSASKVKTVVGKKLTNELVILPEKAKASEIVYTSSNPKVVSINQDGSYSMVGAGTAVITAKGPDGTIARTTYTVQPAAVTGVKFPILIKEMNIGQIRNVSAAVTPSYAGDPSLTYSTGNRLIARVDRDGNVAAVGVGNTYLYATASNGKTARIPIKVNPILPAKIAFDTAVIRMQVNTTYEANIVPYPTYATVGNITYRTGNSKIATVDENGVVTAHTVGNTYLYAETADGIVTRVAVDIK